MGAIALNLFLYLLLRGGREVCGREGEETGEKNDSIGFNHTTLGVYIFVCAVWFCIYKL